MKITSIDNIEELGVSHNPKIKKRVLVSNGNVENVTNLSRAVFPPGEIAYSHCHSDMTEIFLIESGQGIITVNGDSFPLKSGICVTVEPNEMHEIKNSGSAEMVILCIGIKT